MEVEEAERERFVKSKQQQVKQLENDEPDEQGGTDEICASETETAENNRKKEREDGWEAGDAVAVVEKDDSEEMPELVTPSSMPNEVVTPSAIPNEVVTLSAIPNEVVTPSAMPNEVVTPSAMPHEVVTPSAMPNEVEEEPSESGSVGPLHDSPVADRSSKGDSSMDIDSIGDEKPRALSDDGAVSPPNSANNKEDINDKAVCVDVGASGETLGVVDSISASGASNVDSSAVDKGEDEAAAVSPSGGEELRISSAPFAEMSQAAESGDLVGNGGSDSEQRTLDKKASFVMQLIQEREAAAAKAAQALAAVKATSAGKVVPPVKPVPSGKVAVFGPVPVAKALEEKSPPSPKSPRASVVVTSQQRGAAVVSPSLAALRERKKVESNAWVVNALDEDSTMTKAPEADKTLSPSLIAARKRGLPDRSLWSGQVNNGSAGSGGSGATVPVAPEASTGRRSSKDVGRRVEEKKPRSAGTRSPVSAVAIAPQKAAQAEKAVSPSLAAARMRGIPAKGAWAIGGIGAISFSSASDASPIGNSSFDSQGQALGSRGEPRSDASRVDKKAADDVTIASNFGRGGKIMSPSLAAARSRGLSDRNNWVASGNSTSTAVDTVANKRSSFVNGSQTRVSGSKESPRGRHPPKKAVSTADKGSEGPEETKELSAAAKYVRALASINNGRHDNHADHRSNGNSSTSSGATKTDDKKRPARPRDPSHRKQNASPPPKHKERRRRQQSPTGRNGKGSPTEPKRGGVAAAYTRAISSSSSGTTSRTLSPTPSGGKSLDPTPSPGAGGAAAEVATIRAPKSDIPDAGGVNVKEMRSKLFGLGGGIAGGGIGGGYNDIGDGLGPPRTTKAGPPEPARGPIGGPWDEEKV